MGALLGGREISAGYGRDAARRGGSLTGAGGGWGGIVGPNGAGKTPLLKAIVGELTRLGGTVAWDGAALSGQGAAWLAPRGLVQIVEGTRAFAGMSVRENLDLGALCASKQVTRKG